MIIFGIVVSVFVYAMLKYKMSFYATHYNQFFHNGVELSDIKDQTESETESDTETDSKPSIVKRRMVLIN